MKVNISATAMKVLSARLQPNADAELLHVLGEAIKANNVDVVDNILGLKRPTSRWAMATLDGLIFTDRYDALGVARPKRESMCKRGCEGTGWIPVYVAASDVREDKSSASHVETEDDVELLSLWREAEAVKPSGDGWNFVLCPGCNGSGLRAADASEWQVLKEGLCRRFEFDDRRKLASFLASLKNADNLANHHADTSTFGNTVLVTYCTHAAGDTITELDYSSARAADSIALTYGMKTAGGQGSGNFGHVGRPGAIGGSASSVSNFDPLKAIIDHGLKPPTRGTPEQMAKLHAAYSLIDKLLHDPDIGMQLYSTINTATPATLKDRIHMLETGNSFPIMGGKAPEKVVGLASNPLAELVALLSDDKDGEFLAKVIIEHFKLRAAGGSGSGNFGHSGRPGERGGSGKGEGGTDAALDPWKSSGGWEHTGIEWKQEVDPKTGRPIPIKVKTVDDAVPLVLDGKVVEVPDIAGAHTLISRLAQMADDAKAKGEKAPDYDLCQVSVAGSNMFCAESLRNAKYPNGVPRLEMPQLGGKPVAGSEADKLPRNPWDPKEVDGSEKFISHLQGLGIKTERGTIPAASLKASQRELIGNKIGKMMNDEGFDPAKNPIFISNDDYVVDGHHRWAAVVARDAKDNKLGDIKMNYIRVNAPITEVLHLANAWSQKFGIQQAAGVTKQAKATGVHKG